MGETRLTDPIEDLVHQLRQTDLRPSPAVDALFSQLVDRALSAPPDHPYLRDPLLLAEIRRICAEGETQLERCWAARVCADPARLDDFPYLGNYRDLARAEHQALLSASARPLRHVVFAGCGPLPLTAIMLGYLASHLHITCLEIDATSASLASAVIDTLAPPGHQIVVVHADAAHHDFARADAILLAALVGSTQREKLALLENIARTIDPDVTLAARSVPADGRQMLYPRLDPAGPGASVAVLGEWLPPPGVINSLLLMRPAPNVPSG